MFSTLESTWDRSARRGWTTVASLTFQAIGLSLLLLLPLLTIPTIPKLQWFDPLPVPEAPASPLPASGRHLAHPSNFNHEELMSPPRIPDTIARLDEQPISSSPDVSDLGVVGAKGVRARGVLGSPNISVEAPLPPPVPAPIHPIRLSHWAEANLIYRVQPVYPPIARAARAQGSVELRATISKTGLIENLTLISGHPTLSQSAIEAVRQWRYRPYLLNGEAVEVETEVTVNFVLSEN